MTEYSPGTLVRARDREWVVLPESADGFLVLRPLGGTDDDVTGVFPTLEPVAAASFPPPTVADLGDHASARLLRDALRIGFRSSAGPFRSLARIAVQPRSYQLVPLMMALRQDPVRLLIADDVGIGKTVEAGLVAAELLATGQARGVTVLCSPALAEQWQAELRDKFGIHAAAVLPSTVTALERGSGFDETVFDRYSATVVSTDFIKSPRRRDEFVRAAPDLLIVDEAHTSVSDGSAGPRSPTTQRHQLLQRLAADRTRHLLLVTATPHSGQEAGFRNLLALLEEGLADVDLDDAQGRTRLARHYVQRRRGDIRKYLDEETPFPSDRRTQERPYSLTPAYLDLFHRVLAYARESVTDPAAAGARQRVRWWSALALLRALASSPAAAAATLRTRAANASATSVEEADDIGRSTVLDLADDTALEGLDVTPGALTVPEPVEGPVEGPGATSEARRLLAFARAAEALTGPRHDAKLAEVTASVAELLADGYDPIVFCRFIPTAEYVADHLARTLRATARVAVVTGDLPPSERVERIAELGDHPGRVVLVATDCLSEGVNLQDHFQAVVHYDLAWNPTRHEQREGRVDRFGQTRDLVRAVTIYGTDNQIDGLVLEVLLRKHQAIRKATGVSVPVPASSDSVVEAVLEGLLLRGRDSDADQLELDGIADSQRRQLDLAWQSAAEAEKASRTKYAQEGIRPAEVAAEVAALREALGSPGDVEAFLRTSLLALGATVTETDGGFRATTAPLPQGLRQGLVAGHAEPLPFHRVPPAPRRAALAARTDPNVETIAEFVLDAALDPQSLPADLADRLARRAGVFRSEASARTTTVLLLRHRMHLRLPGGTTQVAEHAQLVGCTGSLTDPQWLPPEDVTLLVDAPAAAIGRDGLTLDRLTAALAALPAAQPHLDEFGDRAAAALAESHRRVRQAGGEKIRGLAVEPIRPTDVLGVWVYLPRVPR